MIGKHLEWLVWYQNTQNPFVITETLGMGGI